jgi:hypothetical protein
VDTRRQLRAWILVLALVSFLAGLAAGIGFERRRDEPSGAFALYRERLVRDFDLSPARERGLALLLENYERELERLETRGLEGLEPELVAVGERFQGWIRELVIPPSQWERFDLMLGEPGGDQPH